MNDKLNNLKKAAEGEFSSFAYDGYFDDDINEANFAGQCAPGVIPAYDDTIVFSIENTDTANDLDAVLFGSFEGATQPTGIVIEINDGAITHAELKRRSETKPILISGIKMLTTCTTGLGFKSIVIGKRSDTGNDNDVRYFPSKLQSAQNYDDKVLDDPNFNLLVDGSTSATITVLAATTFTLIATVKSRLTPAETLIGQSGKETTRVPRTTGNPLYDLQMNILNQRKKAVAKLNM